MLKVIIYNIKSKEHVMVHQRRNESETSNPSDQEMADGGGTFLGRLRLQIRMFALKVRTKFIAYIFKFSDFWL